MRTWIGLPWVVLAALGWTAGCGSSAASDSGGPGNKPDTEPPWLHGDPDNVFATTEEGSAKSLGSGGAAGSGPGSFGGAGGAQAADPLGTLCPGYSTGAYSHTLTASAVDPGNLAAATRAREVLLRGETPVPGFVRPADFVNYFGWAPPANVADGQLGGSLELRPRKVAGVEIPNQFELNVGVVAGKVSRPPVALTVVIDSSQSTEALARTKATLEALASALKSGDHVTLMSADPSVPLLETKEPAAELAQLASQLTLGSGGTVGARLPAAYDRAKSYPPGSWNRVVVIGDGEESVDEVDYSRIESEAANASIFLTVLGVSGQGGYGDAGLHRLARQGRGRYLYMDSVSEPAAVFAARFDEVFGLARDKVRIRVDLPSYMHAIDPEPVGGNGAPRDKYLAPGEWAHFVFHVTVCSGEAIHDGTTGPEPLTATVTSTLADGTTAAPELKLGALPVKKYLALTAHPGLDKLAAIRSFVDALKYPEATRFAEAKAQLSANASPGPELLALLAKHPGFPKD